MVLTRKHIAALIMIIFAAGMVLSGIRKYESAQTMAGVGVKVVVDAGHGAPDGGAVGISGTVEKDVNLAIAKKLAEVLEGRGAAVVMTRDGDSGIYDSSAQTIREMKVSDMNNRRDIIKKSNADLFLSIHMNSFSDKDANGLHIFYDKEHPRIEELAEKIRDGIGDVAGAEVHSVKTADERLFLMKNPSTPSILIECGFLSNPEEEQKLNNEEYQSKIAWAIADEVAEYYDMGR